jgi:hypothetical protein
VDKRRRGATLIFATGRLHAIPTVKQQDHRLKEQAQGCTLPQHSRLHLKESDGDSSRPRQYICPAATGREDGEIIDAVSSSLPARVKIVFADMTTVIARSFRRGDSFERHCN